ncbi:MAG: hypothetical protein M1839_007836 [Geoglossum umbratile]|nr:MAG: hypothetical protein M1839_007836 [Geoglossum umbratile]
MRRLPRLGRSIGVLRDPPALPSTAQRSCSACRSHRHLLPRATTTNFSTQPSRPARRQNNTEPEKIPLTERIRRKLWGTEKPPGQEDPYDQRNRRTRAVSTETVDEEASRTAVAKEGETYVPASTWDGLEHVGGFSGWWEQNWDPEHAFKPSMRFIPTERLTSSQALTSALHRAVVEVFTLQQAGRPMGDVCNIPNAFSEDITAGVQVRVDGRGVVSLEYPSEDAREAILRAAVAGEATVDDGPEAVEAGAGAGAEAPATEPAIREEGLRAAEEQISIAEEPTTTDSTASTIDETLTEQISAWDPSWLSTPLTDEALKFHILKRTTHLTGHAIPDPLLPTLRTLQNLQSHLLTPPPPKKLAAVLLENAALAALPNVKVYDRRVTPIDKEKTVGRWKVIERELRERGLPVTGHA